MRHSGAVLGVVLICIPINEKLYEKQCELTRVSTGILIFLFFFLPIDFSFFFFLFFSFSSRCFLSLSTEGSRV